MTRLTGNGLKPRLPPANPQVELSAIGVALINRQAALEVVAELTPDHFSDQRHAELFAAISRLVHDGKPADAVAVADELRRRDPFPGYDWSALILDAQAQPGAVSNAGAYVDTTKGYRQLRRMIQVAGDAIEVAHSTPSDVAGAVDEFARQVFALTDDRAASIVDMPESVADAVAYMQDRAANPGALAGAPTGLTDLDEILGGLQAPGFYVIGARPAMGKSSLGLQVALSAAKATGETALFFTLEMPHRELTSRLICQEARLNSVDVRNGTLTQLDQQKYETTAEKLAGVPLQLVDDAGVTMLDIRAHARRAMASSSGLSVVVVDYIQLMTGRSGAENRQVEVSEISRGFKKLGLELGVPVVGLAQLNRALEARLDKRPMLADLRESGSLEQDADVVMFIYRDEVYDDRSPDKGVAELIVAKNRHGSTGKAKVAFRPQSTRFDNMARGYH